MNIKFRRNLPLLVLSFLSILILLLLGQLPIYFYFIQ